MADVIRPALRITALWKRSAPQIIWGACLAALGVLLVEALFIAGLRPLGPMAWPGLGALVATALGGAAGLAGGSLVLSAYYVFNFLQPHRFPEFYSHPYNTISWLVALGLLAAVILATRPRLLRAAAAEAELAARRQYERALRDSEERLHVIADSLPAFVSYIDTDQRYRFNNRAYEDWLGIPRSDITGRTVREIWGEERYAALRPNIERALRGERVITNTRFSGGVSAASRLRADINPKGEVRASSSWAAISRSLPRPAASCVRSTRASKPPWTARAWRCGTPICAPAACTSARPGPKSWARPAATPSSASTSCSACCTRTTWSR
jgi:PAS domain-containing protein